MYRLSMDELALARLRARMILQLTKSASMIAPRPHPVHDLLTLPDADLREEAARYALMRRLAPALRHYLGGEFQPMTIMAALIERQLKKLAHADALSEHASTLGQLSKNASSHCMDLMAWVAPIPAGSVELQRVVDECLRMVATGLRMQGFHLVDHPCHPSPQVASSAMKTMLPAALLYVSDQAAGPGDLHLKKYECAERVWIDIELVPVDRTAETQMAANYRPMQWSDIQALAQAERVGLESLTQGLRLSL